MKQATVRCLILACGNTLRSDDGVGPWLADWAEERFGGDPGVRVKAPQQWTPDLAQDIAQAASVLFVDCSIEADAGSVEVRAVAPSGPESGLATHHQGAAELLGLARDLYGASPQDAQLLTVGAGSIELGEGFSQEVRIALDQACALIEHTVAAMIGRHPE